MKTDMSYIRVDFRIMNITDDDAKDIPQMMVNFLGRGTNPMLPVDGAWSFGAGQFNLFYADDTEQEAVDKFFFKLKLKYPALEILNDPLSYSLRG